MYGVFTYIRLINEYFPRTFFLVGPIFVGAPRHHRLQDVEKSTNPGAPQLDCSVGRLPKSSLFHCPGEKETCDSIEIQRFQ